ncbi:hypothetical protein OIV83_001187 [Microbotryomycetes sp. JL201]|nr:hypothetical protein OIV83_001187 [Microbotryomycetes sp. JL201]
MGIFVYGWIKQDARLAGLNTLRYSVWISRGAGLCLGIDGLLLVLPILRNIVSVFRPLLAAVVPLDENLWTHRQVAYSLLFWSIVHTTSHYVNMFNVELTQIRKETAWAIMYTQPGGFTGHMMLLIMFLMYTTAHRRIRKQAFETFLYTHHLFILFLLCLYTHATGCFVRGALPSQPVRCLGYNSWTWTIWGGIAYVIERIIREVRPGCISFHILRDDDERRNFVQVRGRRRTALIRVLMHHSGVIELRFSKPSLRYKAGQWLFINVPEISRWQWHPFTISSAPDDAFVAVHIRQVGDWTKDLGRILGCNQRFAVQPSFSKSSEKRDLHSFVDIGSLLIGKDCLPSIRVDGPYGAPAEDVFKFEVALLIGTGIGVTPFASILKNIWHMQQQGKLGFLRRLHFIWCTREVEHFGWFQSLLENLEQTDPVFLRINMYLTQPVDQDTLANIAVHESSAAASDPLTHLKSRTRFGRPNFPSILTTLARQVETGEYLPGREASVKTNVGVFYCGPNELAKTLKVACVDASTPAVRFAFRKEHFVRLSADTLYYA